jgi:hypothetical protein
MTVRDKALNVIRELPEDADIQSIMRELSFLAGLEQASEEIGRGEGIDSAERYLGTHPYGGPICPEFPEGTYRYWLHKNYRIVYEVSDVERQIKVLRFWQCARGDLPAL